MAALATDAAEERGGSRAFGIASLRAAAVRHAPLVVLLALVAGIHIPTMHYYFIGDDFVVIGDIKTRSFNGYMRDVLLLRDTTTSWRPLAMLAYWGEYRLFGLHAMPWRIVNLAVHMATVAMLYTLVLAMTKRQYVALAAAVIFAVSSAAVNTITYISAFQHVLSEFFLIASVYSLFRYVDGEERRAEWYWGSFALFVAAFLSNEGSVVIVAVLAVYYAAATVRERADVANVAVKMAPFALASVVLVGGLTGCNCEDVDESFYSFGWHIPRLTWIYMSRLAYPVGAMPKDASALHWVVGSLVIGVGIYFAVRGPLLARVAAVGMLIGVAPYVPSHFLGSASRYTYMSLPFFAILVALGAGWALERGLRVHAPGANAVAVGALVVVAGLYSWQTMHQTTPFMKTSAPWKALADELQANYPSVTPGSTIYVEDEDGAYTNKVVVRATWVASVGLSLYGKGVLVTALPPADLDRVKEALAASRDQYDRRGIRIVPAEDGRLLLVLQPGARK